ncbi:MAG: S1C family serine protease [Bryobacteraceae bacterium]
MQAELEALAGSLRRITVEVRGRRQGNGAGVVWDADGRIITNAHVARESTQEITLHDGRVLRARLESRDAQLDLASLRVDAKGLPAAEVADSDLLRPGALVIAVGNPLGVIGAVATGVVYEVNGDDWVRANVRLAPGNSGGPLADARGRVAGINCMVAGGLGIAVASNAVERFLGRRRAPPKLGVTLQPVTQPAPGLAVVGIEPGAVAELAGILVGDIMMTTAPVLQRSLRRAQDGLTLDLIRGGKWRRLSVALGNPPKAAA